MKMNDTLDLRRAFSRCTYQHGTQVTNPQGSDSDDEKAQSSTTQVPLVP